MELGGLTRGRYRSIDLSVLVRDYERVLPRLAGHHVRGPSAPSRSGDGCCGYWPAQRSTANPIVGSDGASTDGIATV